MKLVRLIIVPMAFAACFDVARAEDVPHFDMARECRATTQGDAERQACLQDEEKARSQLAGQWDQFPASSRSHCTAETNIDGTPSYVELLTCLQMARDAAKLPKKDIDFKAYPSLIR